MLAGCSQQGASDMAGGNRNSLGQGILGSLRPKADPAVIQRMREEERAKAANEEKQREAGGSTEEQQQQRGSDGTDISSRVLPKVSTDPIAPPAEKAAADANGPIFSPAMASTPQYPGAPAM